MFAMIVDLEPVAKDALQADDSSYVIIEEKEILGAMAAFITATVSKKYPAAKSLETSHLKQYKHVNIICGTSHLHLLPVSLLHLLFHLCFLSP